MEKTRLDSWKSIADYLQRSTRTVQRWHANHALPVHHFRGLKGGAFAYPREIDTWLSAFSQKNGDNGSGASKEANPGIRRSLELTALANEMWEIRSEKNIHLISKLYRDALDEDPGHSGAYFGLANAMILAALQGIVEGPMAYVCAEEALQRMSLLEPDGMGRRYLAAWLDLTWKRKWRKAAAEFDEILSLGHGSSFALYGRSLLYIAEGKLVEASEYALEAWKQNTLATSLSALLCWIPYLAGDYEKSLQLVSEAAITGSYGATHAAIEALALIQSGEIAKHLRRLEGVAYDHPHDQTIQGVLGYSYAVTGQTEKAAGKLDDLGWTRARNSSSRAYASALILIGMERHREAIQALEKCYFGGSQWSFGLRFDPILKQLGGSRRFRDLLRKADPNSASGTRKSFVEPDALLAPLSHPH